jgi:hypothetical protein
MPDERFSYYQRLSAADRKVYRASDAIAAVRVPDADALRPLVSALEAALRGGKRVAVASAASSFVDALLRQLGAPAVNVRVREVRPHIRDGELHGLYTFATEKKGPQIEVWMRTAAHENVVAFRTFFRTLVHEIGHHLDVTVLALKDSFHTQGFFRRESSLVRQLLAERAAPKPEPTTAPTARAHTRTSPQLSLFAKR